MIKKLLLALSFLLSAIVLMSCGSESTYSMCDCEADEMCIDDECKPYPDDFAPAPAE